ncbi:GxxExxY protein [Brevundimonas sp. GCM10030266]|uniref:GxxExxY protein n=1 Tax=Brevundimonas sp. GCM10030266 TaxID=3273386 RepID=UPI003620C303
MGRRVLNAAFAVHTALGPGLLESVYEACLAEELRLAGLRVERQVVVPVQYAIFGWKPATGWICWLRAAWWSRSNRSTPLRRSMRPRC